MQDVFIFHAPLWTFTESGISEAALTTLPLQMKSEIKA